MYSRSDCCTCFDILHINMYTYTCIGERTRMCPGPTPSCPPSPPPRPRPLLNRPPHCRRVRSLGPPHVRRPLLPNSSCSSLPARAVLLTRWLRAQACSRVVRGYLKKKIFGTRHGHVGILYERGSGGRPGTIAKKMRLLTCNSEVFYGLQHPTP